MVTVMVRVKGGGTKVMAGAEVMAGTSRGNARVRDTPRVAAHRKLRGDGLLAHPLEHGHELAHLNAEHDQRGV